MTCPDGLHMLDLAMRLAINLKLNKLVIKTAPLRGRFFIRDEYLRYALRKLARGP